MYCFRPLCSQLPVPDDLSSVQYYTRILSGWAFDPRLIQMLKIAGPKTESCQGKRG